jgi:hypothetical protein
MSSNMKGLNVKAQRTPTITVDEASRFNAMVFFHIKLENHDVIYAGAAPAEYFRMNGAPTRAEVPCVPILSYWRQGSGLKSRFRNATSWFDRRSQGGVNRDRLAQRGIMLSRELEPSL